MNKNELKASRREMISLMEQRLSESRNPEDDLFYCHPSEDRSVLSHALFRVMTDSVKGKIRKEKIPAAPAPIPGGDACRLAHGITGFSRPVALLQCNL